MKVLITGGTGYLGRNLIRDVAKDGHAVRVLSRRTKSEIEPANIEWAQADLAFGDGVPEAVAGVDAIIHAASDPRRSQAVDVNGTKYLVSAARDNGVSHLVYISIVGIDRIPLRYYERKLRTETIIEQSGIPYSILRATQFHSLIHLLISKVANLPMLLPLPTDFRFQSVDESEVSKRLTSLLGKKAQGKVPDMGGPEILTLGEMARTWMSVRGIHRRLLNVPLPGAFPQAFREGRNTTGDGWRGVITWRQWLARPVSGLV